MLADAGVRPHEVHDLRVVVARASTSIEVIVEDVRVIVVAGDRDRVVALGQTGDRVLARRVGHRRHVLFEVVARKRDRHAVEARAFDADAAADAGSRSRMPSNGTVAVSPSASATFFEVVSNE